MQLQHNAPHWRVTDRTKKLVINRNESATLNTSIDQLQETLTNCVGDYVCVTLYTIKPEHLETGSKRGLTFDLMVKLNDPYINGNNKSGSGSSGSGPSFQDMLNLHARIQQYEIDKIKAEYEYNTDKKESAIDKLIGKLADSDALNTLITILMTKVNKPKNVISSPDQISGTSNLNQTISKLQSIDPDVENTLAAMANYLEKNPSVLPQIKSIIGA
jgi:hypothetical protein